MEDTITKIYGGKWWKQIFMYIHLLQRIMEREVKIRKMKRISRQRNFCLMQCQKKLDCLIISDHNTFKWIPQLGIALKEMEENNEIGYRKIIYIPCC